MKENLKSIIIKIIIGIVVGFIVEIGVTKITSAKESNNSNTNYEIINELNDSQNVIIIQGDNNNIHISKK